VSEIRVTVVFVLTLMILLAGAVFVIAGSRPEDQACLRVIARLPVDNQWQKNAHTMKRESGVCTMAEDLDRERIHGH
jgi:hypothetical protein